MNFHHMEGVSYHQQADNNITDVYFNVRSIVPKLDSLRAESLVRTPSIICIVESWLSEDIMDSEIAIDGYQIMRLDRNRHGGGVLAYIHNSLTWDIVLKGFNGLELIAFSIKSPLHAAHHCVTVLYRPPSSPASFFDVFYNTLYKISPARFLSFVLVGDFNVDYFCKNHSYFCKLQSILQTLSLSQVVQFPTHATLNGDRSLIDWAVLSNVELLSECSIIPPLSNSDHNGIYLLLKWKRSAEYVEQQPRTVWRYSLAD